jgi:hypothetical protein
MVFRTNGYDTHEPSVRFADTSPRRTWGGN